MNVEQTETIWKLLTDSAWLLKAHDNGLESERLGRQFVLS